MKVSLSSPPRLGHKVQRIFHLSFPCTQTPYHGNEAQTKENYKKLTDLKTENLKRIGKSICEVDI